MKDYRRAWPLFSLCGLNCGLCPMHQRENGCPAADGDGGAARRGTQTPPLPYGLTMPRRAGIMILAAPAASA